MAKFRIVASAEGKDITVESNARLLRDLISEISNQINTVGMKFIERATKTTLKGDDLLPETDSIIFVQPAGKFDSGSDKNSLEFIKSEIGKLKSEISYKIGFAELVDISTNLILINTILNSDIFSNIYDLNSSEREKLKMYLQKVELDFTSSLIKFEESVKLVEEINERFKAVLDSIQVIKEGILSAEISSSELSPIHTATGDDEDITDISLDDLLNEAESL